MSVRRGIHRTGGPPAARIHRARLRRQRAAFTVLELTIVVIVLWALVGLLLPAVQSAREHARAATCQGNLTQIWLAARSYSNTFEAWPAGTIAHRTPVRYFADDLHHSWTISILLQMDGGHAFGEQWDASRSVYDPVNWPLAARAPVGFQCPSSYVFESGACDYAGIHDGRAEPIDESSRGVFVANRPLRDDDIPDGLAQTVFFGEVRLDDQAAKYLSWMSGSQATLRTTGLPPVTGERQDQDLFPVSYPYGWFVGTGKQSYEEYVEWISGDPNIDPADLTPEQIAQIVEQVHNPPPLRTAASSIGDGEAESADDGITKVGDAVEEEDEEAMDSIDEDELWEDAEYDADGAYDSGYRWSLYGWGGHGSGLEYAFPVIGPEGLRPLPLGSFHTAGVHVAMGDGRVVAISPSLDLIIFSQLGVRNDSLPLVHPIPRESP